ncbi:MAG: DUF2497 domain-containing protein, partial [Gemmatimonadetes bacterium]|nr:DUF2497 domain-containing protein [Gemmatimonadota bacterium]
GGVGPPPAPPGPPPPRMQGEVDAEFSEEADPPVRRG